jgi:hypothetical protein
LRSSVARAPPRPLNGQYVMRRRGLLRPWLFNIAAAASLLLCVLAVALWLGSYWLQPTLIWTEPLRLFGVGVSRGSFFLDDGRQGPGDSGRFTGPAGAAFVFVRSPAAFTTPNALTREWRGLGFEYLERSPPTTFRRVLIPCWPLALAFAIAPALWYRRRGIARERSGEYRCSTCGYDLRATPDRCPECGAAPKPPHNPPTQRTATAGKGAVE